MKIHHTGAYILTLSLFHAHTARSEEFSAQVTAKITEAARSVAHHATTATVTASFFFRPN